GQAAAHRRNVLRYQVLRMGLALRLRAEWEAVLGEAQDLITKDIPPMGGGLTAEGRDALVISRKQQLGKLLDNVFAPTDLPVTVSPNMSRAFDLVRNRLL